MKRLNYYLKKLNNNSLLWLGFLIVGVILAPLFYLYFRDGAGSAVFQVHDQLDETILNYFFNAKYGLEIGDEYETMMCGIPKAALKVNCLLFAPLYKLFSIYYAFLIQHCIVIVTAFFGTYALVRRLTSSSVSGIVSATLFALLPFYAIYGNTVAGTPLLILCIITLEKEKAKSRAGIWAIIGIIYYTLTTCLVLSGWACIGFLTLVILIRWITNKKFPTGLLVALLVLLVSYLLCNLDLIMEVFGGSFVSHREEFSFGWDGTPFWKNLVGILTNGSYVYDAEGKHEKLILVIAFGILCSILFKNKRNKYLFFTLISLATLAVIYAAFSSSLAYELRTYLPGMFKSFQVNRVYYLIPGLIYIAVGISISVIISCFDEKKIILGYFLAAVITLPGFMSILKDENGIFYQNINQINNGSNVTGYVTMKSLYAENLMNTIEESIGEDISEYRVVHIGICPIASLIHGFYTVDGYSNNYPLEYKQKFREIISGELELNDYIKEYFDKWGSRCYLFYHEWGDAYMLGKNFSGTIDNLNVDFNGLKELNCKYIFSAGEIIDPEKYGLSLVGDFNDDESYWEIWVYRIE